MHELTGWRCMVLAACLQYVLSSEDTDAVFLTPYINECKYEDARNISKVDFFKTVGVQANVHSGYITVDNTTESHLFFMLTEAEGGASSAPLLLWTQGGPGLSALFGLLLENGPVGFALNYGGSQPFYKRLNTLQKNMSVLYLDLPVGAGFSFTKVQTAYPSKLEDIVDHVIEFLDQFLKVFSEYKDRPFYLAGESYGARYSVAIANRLLSDRDEVAKQLKLKGIIGGNGFLGPILQTADSSSFLYETSMLTEEGRTNFSYRFAEMTQLLKVNATLTLGYLFQTIFTDFTKRNPTLFQQLTLYDDHASPLYTERPLNMLACFQAINGTRDLKKAIHAGENMTFQYNNPSLLGIFAGDWLRDITNLTEALLGKIDVLFYTGQLDALFPSVNQRKYYYSLNWTDAGTYRTALRHPWVPYPGYYGFAGYIKKTKKFADAVLLGMSHYGAVDKPDEAYHLMTQFISDSSRNAELFSQPNDVGVSGKLPQ
ncbi:venom serine carboxypeptidase-like [Dermacentor variabilis]|uniref:venom serine carboxypeptidase-like n=1 Tax=Dermacentor variabilis TaxID=34621 RepID=UPI003F5C8D99